MQLVSGRLDSSRVAVGQLSFACCNITLLRRISDRCLRGLRCWVRREASTYCGGGRAGCALLLNAPIMITLLSLLSVFMRACHELLLSGRYRVFVFVGFMSLCSDTLFMHCLTPRVCVTKVSF